LIFVTLKSRTYEKSVAIYCATEEHCRKFYEQVTPSSLYFPCNHM